MKRKVVSVFLAIALVLSTFVVSFADTDKDNTVKLIPGKETVTEITYNEYIDIIAKLNNISREKAIALDNQSNKDHEKGLKSIKRSSGMKYWKAEKEFTYPGNRGFKAVCGATIKLDGANSMYQIVGIKNSWTSGAEGRYIWDWSDEGSWTDEMSASQVTIGGSGYFTVTTEVSGGASVDLKGFSVSGQIGGKTQYHSRTFQMVWTWYNPYTK